MRDRHVSAAVERFGSNIGHVIQTSSLFKTAIGFFWTDAPVKRPVECGFRLQSLSMFYQSPFQGSSAVHCIWPSIFAEPLNSDATRSQQLCLDKERRENSISYCCCCCYQVFPPPQRDIGGYQSVLFQRVNTATIKAPSLLYQRNQNFYISAQPRQ